MPAIAVRQHRDDEDDEEVEVDARQACATATLADAGRGCPCSLFAPEKKSDANQPTRVGADREERDVAEVEQAGEADHDVQAERHDDVGERDRSQSVDERR